MSEYRTNPRVHALAVALLAIAVHANALWNGWALDDNFIIAFNNRVHQLTDLSRIWLTPYWPSHGAELGLYRPLTIFLYALQWAVSDGAPWFFHAMNLVLHAVASVLVLFLLRKFVQPAAALVGALIFALHPVHTEVVANVVGQAELVAAIATFGACLLHASRPAGVSVGWGRRVALIGLFAVGLLTKESAIVLPALLVAIDFAQRRAAPTLPGFVQYTRAMGMPIFLLAAAAIGYLALRVDVMGSIGGVDAAPQLPFLRENPEARILTGLRAWPEYVRLLFFPADLSSDYSPAVILPVEGLTAMAVFGFVLMAATALLALATPWAPAAGFPAAWFFISMFPTSNLVLPIGVMVAERLLYTPSLAVAWIASFVWSAVSGTETPIRTRRLAVVGAAVIMIAMGVRTWVRNPDWKDTQAVWRALVRDHPESYRAAWIMGTWHMDSGQNDRGMEYFRIANRLWPNDPQLNNEVAFDHIGRLEYDEAIRLLEHSRTLVPFLSRTDILLAHAYLEKGRARDALEALDRAERNGAAGGFVWPLRAQAFEQLGDFGRAASAWRITLRQPLGEFWSYRAMLARDLARLDLRTEAFAMLDSARAQLAPADTSDRTIRRLEAAVARGCFADPAETTGETCDDPMADWRILVPIPVQVPAEQAAEPGGA